MLLKIKFKFPEQEKVYFVWNGRAVSELVSKFNCGCDFTLPVFYFYVVNWNNMLFNMLD